MGRRGIVHLFVKKNLGAGWGEYAIKWSAVEKQQPVQRGHHKQVLDADDADSEADDLDDDDDYHEINLPSDLSIESLLKACFLKSVCPRCGKDANPTQTKCPECGEPFNFFNITG